MTKQCRLTTHSWLSGATPRPGKRRPCIRGSPRRTEPQPLGSFRAPGRDSAHACALAPRHRQRPPSRDAEQQRASQLLSSCDRVVGAGAATHPLDLSVRPAGIGRGVSRGAALCAGGHCACDVVARGAQVAIGAGGESGVEKGSGGGGTAVAATGDGDGGERRCRTGSCESPWQQYARGTVRSD